MTLPRGWIEVALGEVGRWGSGGTPKASEASFYGGDIPWIRSGDLPDGPIVRHEVTLTEEGLSNSSAKWVKEGAVLVAMYGATIGKLGITTYPVTTNQAIAFIEPAEGIEARYLFENLRSRKSDLIALGQGGAQPNISQEILKAQSFALPPLKEQRRIVARLDALIARLTRTRNELARISLLANRLRKGTLSRAYSGALTAGWRREANAETSSHPPSWRVRELGSVSEIQGGIQVGKDRPASAVLIETPYLRVANVQRGWLDLTEIKSLGATREEITRLLLKDGDILMNEGGDRDKLGRGWVWHDEIKGCIHQNHVFRIRLLDPEFPPEFVSHYANEFGQQYFIDQGKQTTNLASISKKKLSALPVPVPPVEEAKEIVRLINDTFARADRLEDEAARALHLLDRLESAILAKAFRGELVPQNSSDEPAVKLLDRLKAERAAVPRKERNKASRTKHSKELYAMAKKLEEVLAEAEDWISTQDAFQRCGISSAATTAEIEEVYAELRKLDKAGRLETDPIRDDEGRKLYDRLRLKVA